jgi:hypothetical protein
MKPHNKMMADSWFLLISLFMLGGSFRLYGIGGVALFLIAWFLGACFNAGAERRRKQGVNRETIRD